jgi:hypothetical protein
VEAIFLVCGAGGPQLKRNPLGGATLLRLYALAALPLIASCIGRARPTANSLVALPQLAAPDSIARLALDSGVAKCPGSDRRTLIVAGGGLNTQGLVNAGSTELVWLSHVDIQRYADNNGDIDYLEIYPASVRGDSATVSISRSTAFRRPNPNAPVVRDGGTFCDWLAVRRHGAWVVVALRNVITLR